MLEKHKIKISDKELETVEAKVDLLKLTGRNTYRKALEQFANQRLGPERIAGMSRKELDNLTQDEFEAKRDQIHADMNKAISKDKPVFAEISIGETALNAIQSKELFLKRFGYNRFMQAQGLQGLEELDNRAYHQILDRPYKPYKTSSGSGGSNVAADQGEPVHNNRSERG